MEAQVRFKGGGTCLESLTIPPTPGVQLKPDWYRSQLLHRERASTVYYDVLCNDLLVRLFGVGCKLDKGAFCKCPWAPLLSCSGKHRETS